LSVRHYDTAAIREQPSTIAENGELQKSDLKKNIGLVEKQRKMSIRGLKER
jgi:hypothetical protein